MLFVLSICWQDKFWGPGEFTEFKLCRPKVELVVEDTQPQKSSFQAADSSVMIYVSFFPMVFPLDYINLFYAEDLISFSFMLYCLTWTQNEDTEWDKFGNDLYAIPEAPSVQSSFPLPDAQPANKADEDSKIKALIDTPALDWQQWDTHLVFLSASFFILMIDFLTAKMKSNAD